MKFASASSFQFKEAYRHMKRNIVIGDAARVHPIVRAYKYADAAVKAAIGDLYGVEKFHVLICGPDRLVNLILAYKAASEGLSVAIYHGPASEWKDYEEAIMQRLCYYHPSFSKVIEDELGFPKLGSDLETVIENMAIHIDGNIGFGGESLVYQLDCCKLFHDTLTKQSNAVRCWVEPSGSQHSYPTIERMMFWDQEESRIFATENGKFPEFALEADAIWLTGLPSPEMGDLDPQLVSCFGEASRPLMGFDGFFHGQDRLKDILEALGVRP